MTAGLHQKDKTSTDGVLLLSTSASLQGVPAGVSSDPPSSGSSGGARRLPLSRGPRPASWGCGGGGESGAGAWSSLDSSRHRFYTQEGKGAGA